MRMLPKSMPPPFLPTKMKMITILPIVKTIVMISNGGKILNHLMKSNESSDSIKALRTGYQVSLGV